MVNCDLSVTYTGCKEISFVLVTLDLIPYVKLKKKLETNYAALALGNKTEYFCKK